MFELRCSEFELLCSESQVNHLVMDQTSCAPGLVIKHENWILWEAGQPVGTVKSRMDCSARTNPQSGKQLRTRDDSKHWSAQPFQTLWATVYIWWITSSFIASPSPAFAPFRSEE